MQFLFELWGLYALGTIILLTRFAVRIKTVGWRGLRGDDFFSFLVMIFYAADAITVHLICELPSIDSRRHLSNNCVDYLGTNIEAGVAARTHGKPELTSLGEKTRLLTIAKELTRAEIREYELGSKFQLVAWYAYTALIWCLKGTMLCFFSRMTIGTWHKNYVQVVSFLCGITYIAVVLTVCCFIVAIGCLADRLDRSQLDVFPTMQTGSMYLSQSLCLWPY